MLIIVKLNLDPSIGLWRVSTTGARELRHAGLVRLTEPERLVVTDRGASSLLLLSDTKSVPPDGMACTALVTRFINT